MSVHSPNPTELLIAWGKGESEARDRLMSLVYDELRRLAARCMRNERAGHTLQATALVNEVYLRLVDVNRIEVTSRAHFYALARADDAPPAGGLCQGSWQPQTWGTLPQGVAGGGLGRRR